MLSMVAAVSIIEDCAMPERHLTVAQDFGFDTTFEDLTASDSCTSCAVKQDHSAYWTPALYFMYENGTSTLVPQIGGMLA